MRKAKLTVDVQSIVRNDLLDHAPVLQVGEGFPGERAVDLQAVDQHGHGDEAVRLHILVELLGRVLVQDDGVLGLVLNCTEIQISAGSLSSCVFAWPSRCGIV